MLPRNRWFIAAALVYALLGGLVALAWLAFPGALTPYALRAHAHLMLVGFVGMMVFGVALGFGGSLVSVGRHLKNV